MKFKNQNIPRIGKLYAAKYPVEYCKVRVDRIDRTEGAYEFKCTVWVTKELKKLYGYRSGLKETLYIEDFLDFYQGPIITIDNDDLSF